MELSVDTLTNVVRFKIELTMSDFPFRSNIKKQEVSQNLYYSRVIYKLTELSPTTKIGVYNVVCM